MPSHRFILIVAAIVAGCHSDPLLELLPPERTGITFRNEIVEREGLNVLVYEYLYNGGGVATGDVNGDGLPDLYFTANMGPNALYVNQGDLRFREATDEAGVAGGPGWTTGVVMADVNGDGHLDLYVCKSGRVSEPLRTNELYINEGDGTFTERAAEFGLDDASYSTHAVFFDYDLDGDLDLFLVNHPVERFSRFDAELMKLARDPLAGDKLYRNDGGRFMDVTVEAGIYGSPIGFGLSAVAGDLNGDGYPDLFVANDYVEDDYLYINNRDGTFSEEIRERTDVTSYSSMGTDVADVNNDGRLDIITLDMMPEEPVRRKLLQGPLAYEQYTGLLEEGYHRQHMRNMLQLNDGFGAFSEIGRLAGVAETDWSWAPLLADFDNDGFKDLFVTNGYLRDYTDLDFLVFELGAALRQARASDRTLDADSLTRKMPQTPIPNYVYQNADGLAFADRSRDWGVDQPGFSNGAAYVDLDQDGDLDLVVNNINREAFVYRNTADGYPSRRYLAVQLDGPPGNRYAIGARVEVRANDRLFVQEVQPSRGYLSSVAPSVHFGLGSLESVELHVTWPGGRRTILPDVETNRTVTVSIEDASASQPPLASGSAQDRTAPSEESGRFFVAVPDRLGLDFVHAEDAFADFEREPLMPHDLSRLGPATAVGDVNGDGLEDVFFGGAREQAAVLYLQQVDGSFRRAVVAAFDEDAAYEDVAAVLFDADGDGDRDLYVGSGGSWETDDRSVYQDRLYLNMGFGRFERADALPDMPTSTGAVADHDVDGDGDIDLFVAGRVSPGSYPEAPRSYLLVNEGGRFRDATPEALMRPGMVATALWADLDPRHEGAELAVSGEWMPIRLFRIDADRRAEELTASLDGSSGWWNALHAADLDGDGQLDLIAGNTGLNHTLNPDKNSPATIFAGDFAYDGTMAPILTYGAGGERYPVVWRDELLDRIPRLRREFPDYTSYAHATIDDILTPEQMRNALRLDATEFATSVFHNGGDGSFRPVPLPREAQVAPVNDVLTLDVDRDGLLDVILAGNNYGARAAWGPQAAGRGLLLLNRGDMEFDAASSRQSGLYLRGEIRGLKLIQTRIGTLLVAARNDGPLETFGLNFGASPDAVAGMSESVR